MAEKEAESKAQKEVEYPVYHFPKEEEQKPATPAPAIPLSEAIKEKKEEKKEEKPK